MDEWHSVWSLSGGCLETESQDGRCKDRVQLGRCSKPDSPSALLPSFGSSPPWQRDEGDGGLDRHHKPSRSSASSSLSSSSCLPPPFHHKLLEAFLEAQDLDVTLIAHVSARPGRQAALRFSLNGSQLSAMPPGSPQLRIRMPFSDSSPLICEIPRRIEASR